MIFDLILIAIGFTAGWYLYSFSKKVKITKDPNAKLGYTFTW